ncbi:MAG TPA: carboxylesterase family protein [Acidobacteriaceae bacterium]
MQGLRSVFFVAFALLAAPAIFGQAGVVSIDSGKVQGATQGTVESFKGIPFAAPPVGELRWRAPQPTKPWSGVMQATSYSADCMQVPFPSDAAPLGTAPAEDCLYLNVWRPAGTPPDAKLPVMFWIYGGGFVNGGSSPAVYDGSKFAEKGVVFVSANYRLGRFGFFGFPELTKEDADGELGNFGFMDQIAALKWIQRNAGAFGGDPSNVTVFGESAGGFSVSMLLTSPLSGGLFSKAIIESGGGRTNLGGQRYLSTAAPNGPPSADSVGVVFAKSLGIEGTDRGALEALRHLPAEKILGNLNMASMGQPGYSGPMIDGRIVLADPESVYLSGEGWRVPIIIGANSLDIGFGFAKDKDALFAPFGIYRDKAVAAYDPTGNGDLRIVQYSVAMDHMMVEPARFVATVFASEGVPSYEYRFSYVAESMRSKWSGAPHATEIPFVFDTVSAKYGKDLAPLDEKIAQTMLSYWVAFAKTGDPSAGNTPAWPRYSPATDMLMNFTEKGPVAEADPWKARLDVTADYVSASAPPPAPRMPPSP